MPISIPRYSAQGKLSGRSGNVVVEKPEYLTSSSKTDTGESLMKMGKTIAMFDNARQVQERNDLVTQLHMDKDSIYAAFSERSDYNAFTNDLKKSQEERLAAYRKQYPSAAGQLEQRIRLSFEEERIKVSAHGRRIMVGEMEAKWDNSITNVFPRLLANAATDEERKRIVADAQRITEDAVNAMYVTPQKAEKKFNELGSKADYLKLRMTAKTNPDMAQMLLSDREKNFPMMTPEDEFKAYEYIDRVRRQREVEAARAEKELFRQGAQTAYDQMRAWKTGKNPDFEDWLDQNRGITISEGTYQAYINKIEAVRNRSAMSQKMTGAQKQRFYDLKERILLGDPDITQDDILRAGFPDGKENSLMDLIIKPKAVKSQVAITSRRLEETMREAETEPGVKETIRTQFSERVRGVSEPEEIRRIGEDVIKSLPETGWGKPKTAAPTKKGQPAQPVAPTGTMTPNNQGGFVFKKGGK